MNNKELLVLIKATDNICNILKIDKKSCSFLCDGHCSRLEYEGDKDVLEGRVEQSLVAFVHFYRALHTFSGGDEVLMNHWLDVKNKRFNAPPRELIKTCEGVEQLNCYFDELNTHNR